MEDRVPSQEDEESDQEQYAQAMLDDVIEKAYLSWLLFHEPPPYWIENPAG